MNDYKSDKVQIDQIIIYSLNLDWLCLYQVLIDLLRSDGICNPEHESIKQKVSCYILNNKINEDFNNNNSEYEYEIPRLCMDSFMLGLKNVFNYCTGRDIDIIPFDSPELGIYSMCEEKLKSVDKIFMLGVESELKNEIQNEKWKSVLINVDLSERDVESMYEKENRIIEEVKCICKENDVIINI